MAISSTDTKFQFISKSSEGTVVLKGWLDERIEKSNFKNEIRSLLNNHSHVSIDLGQLDRANSSGLRYFALALQEFGSKLILRELPAFLVELINVAAIIPDEVKIASFRVPFYQPEKDVIQEITLEIGRDIPLMADYSGFDCSNLAPPNSGLIPDFEAFEFFTFLAERFASRGTP